MTSFRRVLATSALLVVAVSSSARAQKSATHPTGDTLRFSQTMLANADMDMAGNGSIATVTKSDMQVAIIFGKGDTIVITVEKASMTVSTPMGDQSPDMSVLLNNPSILTLGPDGRFTSVKPAAFFSGGSAELQSLVPADNSFGFELHHPAGALTKGLTWSDTTVKKPKPDDAQKMASTTITKYTVAGDSIIAGHRVIVLDAVVNSDVDMDMSIQNGQMTMKSKIKSASTGRVFFSPDLQIILGATSVGTGGGTQNIEGPMSMTMTVKQKTESAVKLIQ